jgi:hypothetical protein
LLEVVELQRRYPNPVGHQPGIRYSIQGVVR